MPKPDKYNTYKKRILENTISLTHLKVKNQNQTNIQKPLKNKLENQIKQCIKIIIWPTKSKWVWFQAYKVDSIFESQCYPSFPQVKEGKSHGHISRWRIIW